MKITEETAKGYHAIHDGTAFIFSKITLEVIGYYVDKYGHIQSVSTKSLYGDHFKNAVREWHCDEVKIIDYGSISIEQDTPSVYTVSVRDCEIIDLGDTPDGADIGIGDNIYVLPEQYEYRYSRRGHYDSK